MPESHPVATWARFLTSITGIASPSIDALLMNRIGLSPNIRRVPMFGLGCVAGAAGIARAADYVKAYPKQQAVLLSVELCSLTIQKADLSPANLTSSGLFGDGAAAVVVAGEERHNLVAESERLGPEILATRSVFYPHTEEMMGWRISEKGFSIMLSREVPNLVRKQIGQDVDAFLAEYGHTRKLGVPHRRAKGARSHTGFARSERRPTRCFLGLLAEDGQPVLGLGAGGAGRGDETSSGGARDTWTDRDDGTWFLF